LALHNHQVQVGILPQDGRNGYGYGAFLLQFLDQAPLAGQLNPMGTKQPDQSQARAGLEDVVLPVFRCPSHYADGQLEPSKFGRSDYLANGGVFTKAMSLADITDGESATIAVGETTSDQAWALPGAATCDSAPNNGRFGSEHVAGANFVLCDGSVRFITNIINPATFRALGTPRGKDVVGDF
jgi:hypothetical protein